MTELRERKVDVQIKDKEPGAIRLRIFAYHTTLICDLPRGQYADLYPVAHAPRIRVERRESDNYFVNGNCAGNLWGATAEFARIVHEHAKLIHPDDD